jgi:hypothetical protein
MARASRPSPVGYDVELKTHLDPTLVVRGSATYLPSRATATGGRESPQGVDALYVSDGFVSDRFVALDLERIATSATVSFRLTRGRVEGALAPALDDAPVVLLSERALDYDAAQLGVNVPRGGSEILLEYRSTREQSVSTGIEATEALKTVALEFSQDLVRFAGGRASCRFLLTARGALGPSTTAAGDAQADARRLVADHKRLGAGISLAF